MVKESASANAPEFVVVLDGFEELKRLAPTENCEKVEALIATIPAAFAAWGASAIAPAARRSRRVWSL